MANPALPPQERDALVKQLLTARRAVHSARAAGDEADESEAHHAVDEVKQALGERGSAWWTDGAPDLNRHMARSTTYAAWFAKLDTGGEASGASATASLPPNGARLRRI
jgi:hypothetical protein